MSTETENVPLRFDHVAQQVPDIGAAVAWYLRTIPGARVLNQDATWAFVELGRAASANAAFPPPTSATGGRRYFFCPHP